VGGGGGGGWEGGGMYVYVYTFDGTSTRAYTRTQARGATPELRRVADVTLWVNPHSGLTHAMG